MHQSSLEKMRYFRDKYLSSKKDASLNILDIGSLDINGSYRPYFEMFSWKYCGVDLSSGKNVDIVLKNAYHWKEIPGKSADVVISGQSFEHIEYFWITILEITRVLKPLGLCCIIAPSGGYEHRYPVDCWRFYPDGFKALAKFASLVVLEAHTEWKPDQKYDDTSHEWKDTLLVCQKPLLKKTDELKSDLRRLILHRVLIIAS